MKNNGFTLVEVLGVIIILAIIMLLVFTSVINSIKKSNDKIDDATLDLIYNASEMYIQNHPDSFSKENDSTTIIYLEDLIEEDFLPSDLKLSNDSDLDSKCIEVTYQNEYKYELTDCSD